MLSNLMEPHRHDPWIGFLVSMAAKLLPVGWILIPENAEAFPFFASENIEI